MLSKTIVMLIVLFVFNLTAAYANTDKPNLDLLSESKDVSTDATTDNRGKDLKKSFYQKKVLFSYKSFPNLEKCRGQENQYSDTDCFFVVFIYDSALKERMAIHLEDNESQIDSLLGILRDPNLNAKYFHRLIIHFRSELSTVTNYKGLPNRYIIISIPINYGNKMILYKVKRVLRDFNRRTSKTLEKK